MRYFVTIEGTEHVIDVSELPGGSLDVRLLDAESLAKGGAGKPVEVEAMGAPGRLTVHVAGHVLDLVVDGAGPGVTVFASGRRTQATVESAHQRATAGVRSAKASTNAGLISSPMPGKVVKVLVAEGDSVDAGKPLVVVEAMKMENELVAEAPGVVKKIYVQLGDTVESGAKLISIGPVEPA
jgi:biotin carboxyl carrier protein